MKDARFCCRATWLAPALICWISGGAGCITSTSYEPRRTDQVQLVLHNKQLYLHNGKKTIPADQSMPLDIIGEQKHKTFFDCDATAATNYNSAQKHFQIASNISWLDDVYDCATCGCGSTRLCSPLNATFFNFETYNRMQGYALAVDAVNRFNDVPACTGQPAPQPVPATQPEVRTGGEP